MCAQQAADMIDHYVQLVSADHAAIASDDVFSTQLSEQNVRGNSANWNTCDPIRGLRLISDCIFRLQFPDE